MARGRCDEGILFCLTGTEVCIAANKVPGIRAALYVDAETARGPGGGTTPTQRYFPGSMNTGVSLTSIESAGTISSL